MSKSSLRTAIIGLGLILFLAILLVTAWMSDDAYFSFRAIDNLTHGYGLTWNPGERVQSFTNPLWVLLLIPIHLIYSEIFYTSLIVSILLSLAAVYLILRRHAESSMSAVIVLLLLLLSRPFIDFSTSGLENPLNHFLVALFFTIYFLREWNNRTLFQLALVAALGVVTRLDTILIYVPALGLVWWQLRSWASFRAVVLGFLPLIGWEIFSLLYYGFPFPNTYYAKLSTGIDGGALRYQGLLYVVDALKSYPLMMLALVAAMFFPAVTKDHRSLAPAAGIGVYVLYIINIGGDFMSGRFFTVPFVVAVILLARQPFAMKGWRAYAPVIAIVVLGLVPPLWGLLSRSSQAEANGGALVWHGIVNEREWYTPGTGLLDNLGSAEPNQFKLAQYGRQLLADTTRVLAFVSGMTGYYAGPKLCLVELDGLSDPLLARLPTCDTKEWRIGHFKRTLPLGYIETLQNGRNELLDTNLARYYDHLCILTRGDVFSWSRLGEIVRFNLKAYDSLVQQYVAAPLVQLRYREFKELNVSGTPWAFYSTQIIRRNGMSVLLDSAVHCRKVELSVDRDDEYTLVFLLDEKEAGRAEVGCDPATGGRLRVDRLDVPQSAVTAGYDRIEIYPTGGDDRYSVGHLRLLEPDI